MSSRRIDQCEKGKVKRTLIHVTASLLAVSQLAACASGLTFREQDQNTKVRNKWDIIGADLTSGPNPSTGMTDGTLTWWDYAASDVPDQFYRMSMSFYPPAYANEVVREGDTNSVRRIEPNYGYVEVDVDSYLYDHEGRVTAMRGTGQDRLGVIGFKKLCEMSRGYKWEFHEPNTWKLRAFESDVNDSFAAVGKQEAGPIIELCGFAIPAEMAVTLADRRVLRNLTMRRTMVERDGAVERLFEKRNAAIKAMGYSPNERLKLAADGFYDVVGTFSALAAPILDNALKNPDLTAQTRLSLTKARLATVPGQVFEDRAPDAVKQEAERIRIEGIH